MNRTVKLSTLAVFLAGGLFLFFLGCAGFTNPVSKQQADSGVLAAQAALDAEIARVDAIQLQLSKLPSSTDLQAQVNDLKSRAATRPSDPAVTQQAAALSAEVQQVSSLQKEASQLQTTIIPATTKVVQTSTALRDAVYAGDNSGLAGLAALIPPPWGTIAGIGLTALAGFDQARKKQAATAALGQYVQATHQNIDLPTAHAISAAVDSSTRSLIASSGVLPVAADPTPVVAVQPVAQLVVPPQPIIASQYPVTFSSNRSTV